MEIICKQSPEKRSFEDPGTLAAHEDIIVCAACSHHITEPDKQIIVNQNLYHIFTNPHGYVFEIGCFSEAAGCVPVSVSSNEFSWFAGYTWKTGVCQACSVHLGWIFSSGRNYFYALILEKIIFP